MTEEKGQEQGNIVQLPNKREYTAIVREDGDIEALAPKNRKRKATWGVNWIVCYQEAMEWLAKENLPNEQYRVLMYLLSKLDFENYVKLTQVSIAGALGMKQSNVSKAIKALLERNILVTGIKIGQAKTYRLNPRMAYKGKNPEQTVIEYEDLKRRREQEQAGED